MHSGGSGDAAETSNTSWTKHNIRRHVTSPGKAPPDVSRLSTLSPHRARTLPSLRSISPDTADSSPSPQPLIRTIRYEDISQETGNINVAQVLSHNNSLSISRERRRGIRSEFRSDPELPHIPEYSDVEQLSVSPHPDRITPKKSSPSFSNKRHSVSGSFNSLKRAGTKLVRRGIQGVLPVTPNKISEPITSRTPDTPDTPENVIRDHVHESVVISSNSQPSQHLDSDTSPKIGILEDIFRPRISVLCGANASEETVRTFYDAQEMLTTGMESLPPKSKSAVVIDPTKDSISQIPLSLEHDLVNRRVRRAYRTMSEQSPEQEIPINSIMKGTNERQSTNRFTEMDDSETQANHQVSRSSLVPCEASRKPSGNSSLDYATAHQDLSQVVKVSNGKIVGTEQITRGISKVPEHAPLKDRRVASNALFALVKEQLEIDGDDPLTVVLDAMDVVRVSTRGVNFRNTHKNYFPVWASQLKRDGRPYKQEEVVHRILYPT